MERIRVRLTKENLNFINSNNLSITKFINNIIESIRPYEAPKKEETHEQNKEIQIMVQKLIRQSKK